MAVSASLRRQVIEKAGNCCEYCRLAKESNLFKFHVDHIIAIKHGGKDKLDNLAYACYECNGFKGTNIAAADPLIGKATFLYNPRQQLWDEHFRILANGEIEALSAEGRVTIFMLRINDSDRIHQCLFLMKTKRYPCKPQ